jgi:hypothetical protein
VAEEMAQWPAAEKWKQLPAVKVKEQQLGDRVCREASPGRKSTGRLQREARE